MSFTFLSSKSEVKGVGGASVLEPLRNQEDAMAEMNCRPGKNKIFFDEIYNVHSFKKEKERNV